MQSIDLFREARQLLNQSKELREKALSDYHYFCGRIDAINEYLASLGRDTVEEQKSESNSNAKEG
jgi:hypothetical protein